MADQIVQEEDFDFGVQDTTKLDDQVPLELDDGTEAPVADSSEVNAVKTENPLSIAFEEGNYADFVKLGQKFTNGCLLVSNTLIPLIEAALIELLGNTSAYQRQSATITPKLIGLSPVFSFSLDYRVSFWIGTDIPKDAVLKDATYVLDKVSAIKSAKIEECKIDTATGVLSLSGDIGA